MIPEPVQSVLVVVTIFGGLAFHDDIAERIAALDRDTDMADMDVDS